MPRRPYSHLWWLLGPWVKTRLKEVQLALTFPRASDDYYFMHCLIGMFLIIHFSLFLTSRKFNAIDSPTPKLYEDHCLASNVYQIIRSSNKTRSPVPDPNSNALTPASLSGKDRHCHGHVARKFKSCDAGKWLRHGNFEGSEGPSFSGRCGA